MISGWERVAGAAGGTVGGLATATLDGRAVVFAATSVGVYRSADGGLTWTLPGVHTNVPFAEVVALSANFAQDRTIFVCAADGLYRSTDGGDAWQPVLVGSRMLSVATSAAGASGGLVLAGTEGDGVLRSEDAGRTWTGANAGLLDLTAIALALSPRFASDHVGFAGTASGLYRTRNGARSWRSVETGLAEPAVQCLAVSPHFTEDRQVLAGTEADGLLRSDDAGTTWDRPDVLINQGVTAVAFSSRYPSKPTIAVAIESGIALSDDAGRTWRSLTGSPPGLVLSLCFVATRDGEVLLAGLHRQGVARSEDDGAHWEVTHAGLNARLLTSLVLSPDFAHDQTLFAAGPHDGVRVSADEGRTWTERNAGLDDPSILALAASPAYAVDRTLYVATPAGLYVSRDGAANWKRAATEPAPAVPGEASATTGEPARTVAEAAAIEHAVPTVAVAVAAAADEHAAPTVVVARAGGPLLVWDDAAETWRAAGAGFDGLETVLLALSPDYARDRTIFAATRQGGPGASEEVVLWRSVDGGARWQRWFVPDEDAGGQRLIALAVSPNYASDEVVFAGVGSRVVKPMRHARVVRTGERRPVWRGPELGGGAVAVTAVAPSPNVSGDRTVYAATNAGVFVSRDSGETYQPWSEGLVPSAMVALTVSPNYRQDHLVYGLGLGGTIWRRADPV